MIEAIKSKIQNVNPRNFKFLIFLSIITIIPILVLLLISSSENEIQYQKDNPVNGMIYKGLGPRKKTGPCAGIFALKLADGRIICTHGPDPAPAGVDVRKRREPDDLVKKPVVNNKKQDVAGISCNGDGHSGRRVQALYVRASDKEDNYDKYLSSFKNWAVNTDQQVTYSAAQTGGHRVVRYVTDSSCELIIERVTLSPEGDDTFNATVKELSEKGYNRNDRKYLIWRDANLVCGLGTLQNDDKPGLDNASNILTGYALMDNGCWGLEGGKAEIHELAHVLGAVQSSAPHNTGEGHCTDPYDNMCRGTDTAKGYFPMVCPQSNDFLFDCNHDDYFSTNPSEGSYLATHWNMAYSEFLAGDENKRPKYVPNVYSDIYVINRQGSSGKTEIHALSGSSEFREFSVHAASGLHATEGRTWAFALGGFYDDDNLSDIYAINRNGANGKTEVHVLTGKSNFADFGLHATTALESTVSDNWVFDVGSGPDDDPRADLFAINKQGGSGKTEVHILQGGPGKDYKDFSLHAESGLHATDKNWDFVLGSFSDNFGAGTDLYAINRKGASGKTEVHILSGESEYKDFIFHGITPLEATDNSNWSFTTGYFDNDLKADLYAINRNGASGKTEVHILSAASNFSDFILHASSGLESTANSSWTFPPSQDYLSQAVPDPVATVTPTSEPTNPPTIMLTPTVPPAITQNPTIPVSPTTPIPTSGITPTGPVPTFVCGGSPNSICSTPTPGGPTSGANPTITQGPIITSVPSITPSITPGPDNDCLDPRSTPERINDWIKNFVKKINNYIQSIFGNPQNPPPLPQPCVIR